MLAWAKGRGLELSPKVAVAMLPDTSCCQYGSEALNSVSEAGTEYSARNRDNSDPVLTRTATSGQANRSLKRGLVAVEDIKRGETLCSIPLNLGMLIPKCRRVKSERELWQEDGTDLKDKDEPLDGMGGSQGISAIPSWARTAALLLAERNCGHLSPWAPYIASLPSAVPSPLHLQGQLAHEIQWPDMVKSTQVLQQNIASAYSALKTAGNRQHDADFTIKNFTWAASLVLSRAFTLPVHECEGVSDGKARAQGNQGLDSKYEQYVMMPFMDIINHHHQNNADWMAQPIENGRVKVLAKQPIRKGQEVFVSFGPRSNDNLFLNYGFLLDNNPFDSVPLFENFQEAVRWHTNTYPLNASCHSQGAVKPEPQRPGGDGIASGNQLADSSEWNLAWAAAESALVRAQLADGAREGTQPWWDVIDSWYELGYEYMPYRAAPVVRAGGGGSDPALLEVFEALHKCQVAADDLGARDCQTPSCLTPASAGGVQMEMTSEAQSKFNNAFPVENSGIDGKCLAAGSGPPGSAWWQFQVGEQNAPWMLAKVAVIRRCCELLTLLPTAAKEDQDWLAQLGSGFGRGSIAQAEQTSHPITDLVQGLTSNAKWKRESVLRPGMQAGSETGTSRNSRSGSVTDSAVELAVKFRLMRKKVLEETIHKLQTELEHNLTS